MNCADQVANIFIGSDRSQLLAVKVLDHSIRRHASIEIQLRSMHDLSLPDPKDVRQGKRTGFSFTRFAIPELMGYRGRAVYLDADMLVLRDFRELWDVPFDGAKIVIQEDLPDAAQHQRWKAGAPTKRIKQCSVMLLDCEALDWNATEIIAGLDGKYTYEDLLYHMCILDETDIKYGVPFSWNSLEVYEPGKTGLIHYTDMHTQPWVHAGNANGHLWLEEVRLMLEDGALSWADIEREIELGYFRPSLLQEIREAAAGPVQPTTPEQARRYRAIDEEAGFVKHKAVYAAKRARQAAIRAYEAQLARRKGAAAAVLRAVSSTGAGVLSAASAIKQRLVG